VVPVPRRRGRRLRPHEWRIDSGGSRRTGDGACRWRPGMGGEMRVDGKSFRTVWLEGSVVRMIDQPLLPHRFEIATWRPRRTRRARIQTMVVRGAGAIGATGAFGVAQAALQAPDGTSRRSVRRAATCSAPRDRRPNSLLRIRTVLQAIEPRSSIRSVRAKPSRGGAGRSGRRCALVRDDRRARRIAPDRGPRLHALQRGLARVRRLGLGALSVYKAHRNGKQPFVYVDETRPRGQGAQLTAWELQGEGVQHAVIADNATGASWLREDRPGHRRVRSHRAERRRANKIGTYSSAGSREGERQSRSTSRRPPRRIDPDCPDGAPHPDREEREPARRPSTTLGAHRRTASFIRVGAHASRQKRT
jgi:methylthioribose-1-phosphate isomerase